jgi:gamma-polyglutamate biosynthesis protein CapA
MPHTMIARRCVASEVFWLLLIALTAAGVIWFDRDGTLHHLALQQKSSGMLFVGDVMLARNVETLMDARGSDYPFKGIRDTLADYEIVVGNFEASIPEKHQRTPSLAFTFSVAADLAPTLVRNNFTDMTLANNHAYDYGKEAYTHTRETLTTAGLTVGGNPQTLSNDEILYHTIDGVRIAIIPVNMIGSTPPLVHITTVLADAVKKSDMQIISIHWGTEYELVAHESQRALARAFIDAGADAIIGSHPHVVQDIEEYRGAPIFYSLGNCIFDQYWNADVQIGLAVALSFEEKKVQYTLLPLTSIDSRSAPRPMNRVERAQFFDSLAERSEVSLADAITDGVITELFSRSKNTQ